MFEILLVLIVLVVFAAIFPVFILVVGPFYTKYLDWLMEKLGM